MKLDDRELNRALLARQGLSEPLAGSVRQVVEAIGALQAQQWGSIAVALWSRMPAFAPGQLHAALQAGELVVGTSIRRTLHLVSAAQHPSYSTVADAGGANEWKRGRTPPSPAIEGLRRELHARLREPHTNEQICEFIEGWVAANPGAFADDELVAQRKFGWRAFYTWSALLRVPADGSWSDKAPTAYRAAAHVPRTHGTPPVERALADVIRHHLRSFGPAAPDDVAAWIGWNTTPVRAAMESMARELVSFTDDAQRTLYDLPDAPRPGRDTPAPVRFLPAFDSTLLAHAPKRRTRILPEAYRKAVYSGANLRVSPTFLVDGLVAGTWSTAVKRGVATLTLVPLARLAAKDRRALQALGDALLRAIHPEARGHETVLAA